jgi:hypothetical protein
MMGVKTLKERTSRIIVPAILLLIVLVSMSTIPTHATTPSSWVHFNLSPTSAVYYDYDSDGVVEIVLPGAIIEGYSVIKSPYPNLPYVDVADLNGDGINELILYGNGELYIFDGMKQIGHFSVPDVEPIRTHYAYAFDNLIIWRNTTYSIGGDVSNVVPVADRTHLYALYQRNGDLRLLNVLTGEEYCVFSGFSPVYGVLSGSTVYIVALTSDGRLGIIKYPIGGTPQIGVYAVNFQEVEGFNPITGSFYIKADNKLYEASVSLLLVSEWEPISHDEVKNIIYLYKSGEIAIYNVLYGRIEATYNLPLAIKPVFVTGYPKPIVVYPGDKGMYVYYQGVIYITFYGSGYGKVGEPYKFSISVYPPRANYTIIIDGLPVPQNTTSVVFKRIGYHNITVEATDGVITVSRTFKVYVYPRPLQISLEVKEPPKAFSTMTLIVHTKDNGNPVNLSCKVVYANKIYTGTTNSPIYIPIGVPTSEKIPVKVVINSEVYGNIERTYYIPVVKLPVQPEVSFLGNGTFQIQVIANGTSIPVNGTVKVYLGSNILYSGRLPATVKVPTAGNYTLKVRFYPDYVYAFPASTLTVNITYLGERETIPNGTAGIVAVDHIINKTKVIVKNQTVTVTERVPEPVPEPVLNTKEGLFFLGIGIGAGVPVGMVIAVEMIRRRKKEEIETEIEEEGSEGSEEEGGGEPSEKDLFSES